MKYRILSNVVGAELTPLQDCSRLIDALWPYRSYGETEAEIRTLERERDAIRANNWQPDASEPFRASA